MQNYDVIIVGGGHAGVEASWISSQFNLRVALITSPDVPIASAPCNPAVGGVGKGQVVREVDALGGLIGKLADLSGIQYRTLNTSKGYAVQSTRVQIDKIAYSENAERILSSVDNLTIYKEKVQKIQKKEDSFYVLGVNGLSLTSQKIIITTGTFLNGKLHIGSQQEKGGRIRTQASVALEDLFVGVKSLPVRFKTGTPPRILEKTINFSQLEEQPSDENTPNFHCLGPHLSRSMKQRSCYLSRTNPRTMGVIRENIKKSPMYNGQIKAIGPRYCPAIEDKAHRYPDRDIHHIFIEPEGLDLETWYPNGISTGLPVEVQQEFIKTIEGLEDAELAVPGYAVEYDVVDTTYLDHTLQYEEIPGLYFAGQVNGTSGYEEAAGQGIMAGINASCSLLNLEECVLSRENTYIGVMIEDLISNKRDEPYRLFTARAENRLKIREDNVFQRIWPYRKKFKLNHSIDRFLENINLEINCLSELCEEVDFKKNEENEAYFNSMGYGPIINNRMTLTEVLKLSHLDPIKVLQHEANRLGGQFNHLTINTVAICKRYEGFIKRADEQNKKMLGLDKRQIIWEDLARSTNISFECKERIKMIRPKTFRQLRLIEGIRPATLAIVAGKVY